MSICAVMGTHTTNFCAVTEKVGAARGAERSDLRAHRDEGASSTRQNTCTAKVNEIRSHTSETMFVPCSQASAAKISNELVTLERRSHRDLDDALHRLSSRTGISYWTLRDWWHHADSTNDVLPRTWERLVTAYYVECAHQLRLAAHNLQQAKLLYGSEPPATQLNLNI